MKNIKYVLMGLVFMFLLNNAYAGFFIEIKNNYGAFKAYMKSELNSEAYLLAKIPSGQNYLWNMGEPYYYNPLVTPKLPYAYKAYLLIEDASNKNNYCKITVEVTTTEQPLKDHYEIKGTDPHNMTCNNICKGTKDVQNSLQCEIVLQH